MGAIAAAYLLQTVTPIRLDTDSVRYLTLGLDLADGNELTRVGTPLGYPATIALLERAGLGSTNWIVALNCAFLALGAGAVWRISGDSEMVIRQWTLLLTLLSFAVILTIPLPNAEAVFFGLSLAAVAVMREAWKERLGGPVRLLAIAFLLTVASISVKLAGLALVPVFMWTVVAVARARGKGVLFRLSAPPILAAIVLLVLITVGATQQGAIQRYVAESADRFSQPTTYLVKRSLLTLRGPGVLLMNAPVARFDALRPYLPLVGIVPVALLFLRRRWIAFSGPIPVYLLSYVLLLFVWPFYSTRLWTPVVPLLILYVVTAAKSISGTRKGRYIVTAAAAWYMVMGVTALIYTSRISLAGEDFRNRYGSNAGLATPGNQDRVHDARAQAIIARFDAGNPAWRWLR